MTPPDRTIFARTTPLLFVAIWATGFVVARLVAGHVDPMTFLALRFVLSAAAFAGLAFVLGAAWPQGVVAWRNALITGVLLQGIYLGGIFWSVRHGLPAGVSALVTGLQPLLTGVLSGWLLREGVGVRRWWGIGAGFVGAGMVLWPQLSGVGAVGVAPLAASGVSMLGITLGTIWQKRTGTALHLATNGAVQFMGAVLLVGPLALATEAGRFDFSWQAVAGMAWGVFGLSLGAATLLLLLIRRGAVAGVASLFYLVPPVVAAIAFLVFGEALVLVQVAGMGVAAAGVWLASSGGAR